MPTPSPVQRCAYCHRVFEKGERRRYVYPVPLPEREGPWDGRLACLGCWPGVAERQEAQGPSLPTLLTR